jgi:hypothetical protein
MKRILVTISPVIFLLFTACGGDDKAPPPKAACANEESLKNLHCISQIAQQICCSEQSAVTSSYGAYCEAVTNPAMTPGGYTLPSPPQPPPPQGQVPPQIPGCQASTKPLTCNEAITNFELQYKTTYASCQSGETAAWKQQQGAAVITCVGQSQGITTTEQFYSSAQAQCQASYAYQNFSSQVPSGITSEIPSGILPGAPGAASGAGGAGAPPTLDGGNNVPGLVGIVNNPIGNNPVGNNPNGSPSNLPIAGVPTATEPPAPIASEPPRRLGFTSSEVVRLGEDTIPPDFR